MGRSTKRRTKHRGNAAGMIESRGRGRSHAPVKGKGTGKTGGKVDPRMREPTWRSAFTRALIAAGIFVVVLGLLSKGAIVPVLITGILLLGIYTPFGFYTDRFFYRRRLRKVSEARGRPRR